jgi:large subunit ribosomal protein L17
MRHRSGKATLNRPADQRKAMLRSLVTSLFQEGSVKTTDAKAKVLQADAEKLITLIKRSLAKNEEFNAIRDVKQVLFTESAQRAAIEFAKQTKKTSGFIRVTRIGMRDGDAALIMQVDLISEK